MQTADDLTILYIYADMVKDLKTRYNSGIECKPNGMKLICKPCPLHTDDATDQFVFDPLVERKQYCNYGEQNIIKNAHLHLAEEYAKKDREKKLKLLTGKDEENLQSIYESIIPTLKEQYKLETCEQKGYGLSCYPCPFHPGVVNDRLILDPRDPNRFVTCAKEPFTNHLELLDSPHLSADVLTKIKDFVKKAKVKDIDALISEIIERNYVTNNIIITIKDSSPEGYKAFRYVQKEGIYEYLSPGVITSELLKMYQKLTGNKPSLSLLDEMKSNVYTLTLREGDESIFFPRKGDIYYLVGRVRDIEINTKTYEVRFLAKDPINRPFLSRMPYDFAIDPPTDEPPEMSIFKKYTTPKHYVNIKIMLAKAFILKGLDYIFLNFSRGHGTGKTALFSIIENLAGDVVVRAKPKHFYNQFFESRLIGKSILLLEEYKGHSERVNEDLKQFSSVDGAIEGDKKFSTGVKAQNTLSVVINTNRIELNEQFLNEKAFMDRLVITPFTHKWVREEYPSWTQEQKERIVLYIIKNVVPDVLSGKLKPVTYPPLIVKSWVEREDKIPPNGIEWFLKDNAYPDTNEKNSNAKFVPISEAYKYYQLWCDNHEEYLPLSDEEFEDLLYYPTMNEYLHEKDGVKGIYMSKVNLTHFM